MQFKIDECYLSDVSIRKEWGVYDHIPENELTQEQLVKILKNQDRCSMIGHTDSPEFAELRNSLEEQGYIVTQRSWWNGDRVLKPFTLNGVQFNTGDQFPCATAMKSHLKYKVM